MKMGIIGVSLAILTISLCSCEEEPDPSYVWGDMHCNECGTDGFEVNGTLGKGGEDYWGFCKRTDTGLSFAVAQKDPGSTSFTSEYLFQFVGIQGPPSIGVYSSDGSIFDDPEKYTTFDSMQIRRTNIWNMDYEEAPYPDECFVRLFAEPAKGELTAEEYGSEEFEIFVHIECTGISVEPTQQGQALTGMSAKLWFDKCD